MTVCSDTNLNRQIIAERKKECMGMLKRDDQMAYDCVIESCKKFGKPELVVIHCKNKLYVFDDS
jgi:hypothetical protein